MIPRIALLVLLAGGPFVLSGCSLLQGAPGMVSRMFSAGGRAISGVGRTIGLGSDNNAVQPFRLETGEIEKVRNGDTAIPPLQKEQTNDADHVAAR